MRQKTKKIFFVYASNKVMQGSTNMRAHQFKKMLEPYLATKYELLLSEVSIPPKFLRNGYTLKRAFRTWGRSLPDNCIVFVTKACIQHFIPDLIDLLNRKNIKVCFDYADSDFSIGPQGLPDMHVCTSITQFKYLKKYQEDNPNFSGSVSVVLQNYDLALIDFKPKVINTYECAYIGTPARTFLTSQIESEITIVPALGVSGMQEILTRLPNFNAHYAVRIPQDEGSLLAKPFTKGFVAAACNSVLLTDRQTHDAVEFLGDDYPYMVNNLEENEILQVIDYMRATFETKVWWNAKDQIRDMHARVCPSSLAKQFEVCVENI